jgi:hypothetical protein
MRINRSLIRRGDAERDSQFLWLASCEFGPGSLRDWRSVGIARKTSSDRVEIGGGVPDGSRIAEGKSATMPDIASRTGCQPAARRLQPNDSATRRGNSNRSAASVASATGTIRAATAAAAPPLEPPGVTPCRHGLNVAPESFGSVESDQPFSGALDLPTRRKPAALMRLTPSEFRRGLLPHC